MAPDSKDVQKMLTAAKVKKLELTNNITLQSQLRKELSKVEQNLTNAENSTQLICSKECTVRKIANERERSLRHASALRDVMSRNLASIRKRMERLSLSKSENVKEIRRHGIEKLEQFPKEDHLKKQGDIITLLSSKLNTTFLRDQEACSILETEIHELRSELTAKSDVNNDMSAKIVAVKKDITSKRDLLNAATKKRNELMMTVKEYITTLDERKAQLEKLLVSIPSKTEVEKLEETLKMQQVELDVAKQQMAEYDSECQKLQTTLEKLEAESLAEIEHIKREKQAAQEDLRKEFLQLECEVQDKEITIGIVVPKKDSFKQRVLKEYPGMSIEEIEKAQDALDGEKSLKLRQIEAELQVAKSTYHEAEINGTNVLNDFASSLEVEIAEIIELETNLAQRKQTIEENLIKIMADMEYKKNKETSLVAELDQLERSKSDLAKSTCFSPRKLRETKQIIPVKIEDLRASAIPVINGIIPFSPKTVKTKAERRKKNLRAFDGDLEYTDLKLIDGEWVLIDKPENNNTVKRSCEGPRIMKLSKPVRRNVQAETFNGPTRMPSAIPHDDPLVDVFDIETPNDVHVQPPLEFRDDLNDSLFDGNTEAEEDSLFGDSPSRTMRCIPENIFLNSTITSVGEKSTPPINDSLNDSLRDSDDSDQSIWD